MGCGRGYPFPPGEGYVEPREQKLNFSLEMACFGSFSAILFGCVLARKMLNFLPEVLICGR